jgi:exonuclease SbcD
MKILHTADWHLGQTFYEYDRREEHLHFLEWLKQQIRQHEIDVLLIAGDVFDSPNPSAESQRMYYRFLREVTSENPSVQIIIIAGNHDRIRSNSALMSFTWCPNVTFLMSEELSSVYFKDLNLEAMNVTVRGVVRRNAEGDIDLQHLIVPLYTEGEVTAYCLAVPYLRQGDYPSAENYSKGVQLLYEQLFNEVKEKGLPVIAMGHLQATGSEISEDDRSERTVIGGLECVSPDAFDEAIAYTALGHLHRSQRVSHRENVRYSGTPMPMSFAERNNASGVVMITISAEGTGIERLAFEPLAGVMSIPRQARPLEEVLQAIGDLPDGDVTLRSPYLEIKILMTEPEPSYKYKIEEALKGKAVRLARIAAMLPQKKASGIVATSYEELQTIRPLDMALDVFKRKYGGTEMPDTMKQLLESVIKEAGV